MRKQFALILFALGSGRRRAGRNGAILIALVLITFAYTSVLFLTEALRQEFYGAAEALPDLTIQRLVAGRPALIQDEHQEQVKNILGVTRIQPRIWGYYFVPYLSGNLTIVGADLKNPETLEDFRLVVQEGRSPKPSVSGEVVIGESLASFLGLGLDDEFMLPTVPTDQWMKIVGIFYSAVSMWTADVILMNHNDARNLLNVPEGWFTDISVHLSTPDEATVAARKIAEMIPGARIIDRQLMRRTYDLTFSTRGGILAAMLMPAFLAFLILAWDRLSGVNAREQHEIGVMKAVGWKTGDVITVRLWESAWLGLTGALAGIICAYVYVFHTQAPGLSWVLFGWSCLYPALKLAPSVHPSQVFTLLCLIVIPFMAISIVPAWRSATRDPDQLLRGFP